MNRRQMKEKLPASTGSAAPSLPRDGEREQLLHHSDRQYDVQLANNLAASIFDFAHDIGKTLLSSSTQKFEIFSPTSIAAALNLVLLGSKGKTFTELMDALGYSRSNFFLLKN